MNRLHHWLRVVVLSLLLVGGALLATASNMPAHAATVPVAGPALPRAASGQVTVIVLDNSGSMAQNDPNGLRCSAANAYIDLSGPGDYIGLIDLDNNNSSGTSGGAHNFRLATKWADPTETATYQDRANLRALIAQKSNNCAPDGNTPTYDALAQALAMLKSSTQGGKSGSVILLTDGAPDPNTSAQVSAVQTDLLPQFKQNGWPIDTIALGANATDNGIDYHGFLSGIANATSGKFYDDSQGPVSGVSPLNLAGFFVDIFALRSGRTPGPTIAPTQLGGATVSRNFSVGSYVSHLDVVAVKDQPGTSVTATAPDGTVISSNAAGALVSTDPHYVIFSFDSPQAGPWQLNVTGNGQFLMDSLVVSTLSMTITSPAAGKPQPLGQPVNITASLRDQNNAVIQNFQVKAVVQYAGKGNVTPRELTLTDPNSSGNYATQLTLPTDAPTGSYEIVVTARAASEDAVSAQTVAQFELFPTPVLISPVTGKPTADLITAHVVNWDGVLRFVYGTLPLYSSTIIGWHPSDWPLGGLAADNSALLNGQVLIGTQLYSNATVTATATRDGSNAILPVSVENDGGGNFRLHFPSGARGSYHVQLTARGSYKDSFGDLTSTSAPIAVVLGYPSTWDEVRAWLITALYTVMLVGFLLFFVYGPINYVARAKPSTRARLVDQSINARARLRSQLDPGTPIIWRGWSLRRYFAPNRLPAGEVALPNNLTFVFRRGNEVAIKVRQNRRANAAAEWSIDGRRVTPADGSATLVSHMRLAYNEAGQRQEWKFEQDTMGLDGSSGVQGGVRDRLESTAGNLGLRDRLRRGRGLRND